MIYAKAVGVFYHGGCTDQPHLPAVDGGESNPGPSEGRARGGGDAGVCRGGQGRRRARTFHQGRRAAGLGGAVAHAGRGQFSMEES